MKILIFEGISTSGKSTVINGLKNGFSPAKSVDVFDEQQTLMPILSKTNDLCHDFFKDLITSALSKRSDLVIFDRLYLTQAFRASGTLADYADLERRLVVSGSVFSIFLSVDEATISERIMNAMAHRDPSWREYVYKKNVTIENITKYYVNQQRHQLKLLKTSHIPYQIFDATKHNYETIIEEIKKKILPDL